MGKDAENSVTYYLLLDRTHRDDLAAIRQWEHLKVAFEADDTWIKGFSFAEINAVQVKTIPFKQLFFEKQGQLFPLNSGLPDRIVPALLWTPITRALPVTLPKCNHNYFGIDEYISFRVVPAQEQKETVAIMVALSDLGAYLQYAPPVRLQKIRWVLCDMEQALLMGTPLLPITGMAYWLRDCFLLPAGFDIDLHILTREFGQLLNPAGNELICCNTDGSTSFIDRLSFQPLSLASYRNTIKGLPVI